MENFSVTNKPPQRYWTVCRTLIEEVLEGEKVRGRVIQTDNPDGSVVLIDQQVDFPIEPDKHVRGRLWISEIAVDGDGKLHHGALIEALPSPNAVDDRMLDRAYQPRGRNEIGDGKTMRVFAVGASPTEAVRAFCWSINDLADEDDIYVESGSECTNTNTDDPLFQWEARFRLRSSGTSMKAAGKYVPGGAVLTWWK